MQASAECKRVWATIRAQVRQREPEAGSGREAAGLGGLCLTADLAWWSQGLVRRGRDGRARGFRLGGDEEGKQGKDDDGG